MRNFTAVEVVATSAASGYDLSQTAVKLSLTVFIVCCAIVISYLVYSFTTGHTSSSWDSIGELFMLALNSRRPEHMSNTSAGVKTLATYREPIFVRVNEDESLEVVFANDPGAKYTDWRNVARNEKYG